MRPVSQKQVFPCQVLIYIILSHNENELFPSYWTFELFLSHHHVIPMFPNLLVLEPFILLHISEEPKAFLFIWVTHIQSQFTLEIKTKENLKYFSSFT